MKLLHTDPERELGDWEAFAADAISIDSLGDTFKERRQKIGATQQELADAADLARVQIVRIEADSNNPSLATVVKVWSGLIELARQKDQPSGPS